MIPVLIMSHCFFSPFDFSCVCFGCSFAVAGNAQRASWCSWALICLPHCGSRGESDVIWDGEFLSFGLVPVSVLRPARLRVPGVDLCISATVSAGFFRIRVSRPPDARECGASEVLLPRAAV